MVNVIYNDTEYPLAKKTLKIAKLIDAAHAISTPTSESYRKQYECVVACIGENTAAELLDGKSVDEIDLTNLSILFLKIEQAYVKPVEEANSEIQDKENIMQEIKELGEAVEKLSKAKDIAALAKSVK